MKTPKNTLFLLATLFATPAFATWVTLEGGSTAESAVSFADDYSNTTELVLVAPTDATSTYFDANGKTIQYLKADGSANVNVSGGFTIDAPANGISLLFDGSSNIDSRLTLSNGTYNFGKAEGSSLALFDFKINSFVGTASTPVPQKAVVFDSDSIVNVYAQQATFYGPYYGQRISLPAYIVKGTFNVNDPSGDGYGNIHLRWDTSTIDGTVRGARPGMQIDGGTLNVNDVRVDNYCNIALINGGEINSTGTFTLYGNNEDLAPVFNVNEGTTANLNNFVHRVGILNGTNIQKGVKTTVYGTLNVAGKFSFEFQDKDKMPEVDSVLNVKGRADINEVEIDHAGKILASDGGVINVNSLILEGTKSSTMAMYGGTMNVKNLVINGGFLDMSNSAVLNITGDSYILSSFTQNLQTCQINVAGGTLSYQIADEFRSSNSKTSLNIKNGATLLSESNEFVTGGYGTITVEKGGTLKALSHKTTTKLNVSGALISTKVAGSNFYALTVGSAGVVTFGEGGSLTANENGRISLSGSIIANSGTNSITASQIVFWGQKNSLEVNGENVFVLANGQNRTLLNIASQVTASIKLTDTNEFGQIIFQNDENNNNVRLNLTLDFKGADDYVYFDSVMFSQHARIYVENFENNKIKFGSISRIETALELFDLSTETAIDYQWVATDGGYWLNFATAVPEPAEWAMILGAIALGLAVYRRRK